MILANNGILIVALTMALGLFWDNRLLIALALAMAGVSYIANVLDDWVSHSNGATWMHQTRAAALWVAIGLGVIAYVYMALKLMGLDR